MLPEGFPLTDNGGVFEEHNVQTYLLKPRPVVENLELQEDPGHPVVTANHRFGFRRPKHAWVLLEKLHRLLNPVEELTGPQDLPGNGRLVSAQRRITFLLCIQLCDHIYVSSIVFEDTPVFVINTKIGYIQSDFFQVKDLN